MSNMNELVGLKIVEVRGMEDGSREVVFVTECGRIFRMTHHQDCCEDVCLNDTEGEPSFLLGQTVCSSSGSSSEYTSTEYGVEEWTFYHIRTHKGDVCLRWVGTSNGYYSTSVSFEEMTEDGWL